MTGMVEDLKANEVAMRRAAGDGYSTATDIADWIVRVLKKPFREAHHITGRIVAMAEARRCGLEDFALEASCNRLSPASRRYTVGVEFGRVGRQPHEFRRYGA